MVKIVALKGGATQVFTRASDSEAMALAGELEKEDYTIEIDGKPFLNSAGLDKLYLHQSSGPCPMCSPPGNHGCARCESGKGKYYSVKPTHYHSRKVEGLLGHEGILDILCYECHRKDRYSVYGEGYGEAA